eukprot:350677-Chlamydomonas_euryale.AAC.1
MPVLSAARQRGSSSGRGAVTNGMPLRTPPGWFSSPLQMINSQCRQPMHHGSQVGVGQSGSDSVAVRCRGTQ